MPLFDYKCSTCGAVSELLVKSGDTPVCPSCQSADLVKQPSATSSLSGPPSQRMPGAGDTGCCGSSPGHAGCSGPGSCCGKSF